MRESNRRPFSTNVDGVKRQVVQAQYRRESLPGYLDVPYGDPVPQHSAYRCFQTVSVIVHLRRRKPNRCNAHEAYRANRDERVPNQQPKTPERSGSDRGDSGLGRGHGG